MTLNRRPLLLLDVDGVLNPYAASRDWLDSSNFRKRNTTIADGRTFPVWLDRAHGHMLRNLVELANFELVWCTTWEFEANLYIGPRIGLPELPVITFQRKFSGTLIDYWKFGSVLRYAEGRPLAWFDDEFQVYHEDRDWFTDQRGDVPTLLHLVDPHQGLRASDLETVAEWSAKLTGGPSEATS